MPDNFEIRVDFFLVLALLSVELSFELTILPPDAELK